MSQLTFLPICILFNQSSLSFCSGLNRHEQNTSSKLNFISANMYCMSRLTATNISMQFQFSAFGTYFMKTANMISSYSKLYEQLQKQESAKFISRSFPRFWNRKERHKVRNNLGTMHHQNAYFGQIKVFSVT